MHFEQKNRNNLELSCLTQVRRCLVKFSSLSFTYRHLPIHAHTFSCARLQQTQLKIALSRSSFLRAHTSSGSVLAFAVSSLA